MHLLPALDVPVLVGRCLYASRVVSSLVLRGSSLSLLLFGGFGGVAVSFFLSDLAAWVLAVWPALSCFPPLPSPLGCLLVLFGPVRLSYLWHGVSWLIGSCLPSASWQQRLRPCVGLCPLHHVVGVVHVPLAAALRYSPSGDPESP